MKSVHEPGHALQRVKVGMTGLAIVLVLIGLAGAIFRWASHERPLAVSGARSTSAVLNSSNSADPAGEPLAELGVAPPRGAATADGGAVRR